MFIGMAFWSVFDVIVSSQSTGFWYRTGHLMCIAVSSAILGISSIFLAVSVSLHPFELWIELFEHWYVTKVLTFYGLKNNRLKGKIPLIQH